ncbi:MULTISPECIES: amino acid ABC transporter ATP-binding protein [Ochrobactrum]|jgi:polar amino acid transport system ATP-binding protein|uniref:Amino acid ABC transporter ATP-binding protein n=1 Tax=Ochrobactrum quorumnocens TaxID=271865 RepID=A0A5N1JW65_9HYPH|nr:MULTISPECIES: amino acid ABC transporter ATP-binding protein [Brucella/Ochrobactrum group]KAA9367448.1 amino acid ABC transporter ATP-binding protein [[Ochrobactrum] quorumnocens]MDH7792348.1 polar amino acid transport system ATP-binding protein [Ochrobactrum sp. AN78]
MSEPMIVFDRVSKNYGSMTVLSNINLEVAAGEVISLIGPSGSGKSTLLRCVNHLERIEHGSITVEGELIGYRRDGNFAQELPEKLIARQRARIGMVFQNFNLFGHKTALENVIEAPVHVLGIAKREAEKQAGELLARVGLADKLNHYPRMLSGGQQQRVAIARALAMKPKVLLFDEPTSALDPELVGEVLDVMRSLAADGLTMMVVTHEMSFARDVCNRIAFMQAGKIVECGAPSEILDNPAFERTRSFLSKVH